MSVDTDCFQNIIGLSRSTCECFDEPPVDYNISDSGLYLDELLELGIVEGLVNCANGGELWTLMERAREQGIISFYTDAKAMLLKYYQLIRQPYTGTIGRIKTTKDMTLTAGDYAGTRMFCADVVSGVMVIKKIGTLFNTTGTITLFIYNNLNELLHTLTLNTTANAHNINDVVDIELPLHSDYVDNLEYFFIYQYDGVITPKDNDIKCSCGMWKPLFTTERPYFGSQAEKQYRWNEWVMAGAYKGDATDFDDCPSYTSNYLYGLTFPEIEFKCMIDEVICKESIDFSSNPLAASMAFAIRYKAGELLIDTILRSPNLNRVIMINTEQMQATKAEWILRYNEYMQYFIDNVDVTTNDCLECKDLIKISKKTIWT